MTNHQALQRLKADILLRGLSKSAYRTYTRQVGLFLEQSGKPVEELSEADVRKYIGRMITEKRLEPKTINVYSAAIRFFFAVTLNRNINYLQIPRMKVPKKLPVILTRDEISQLIAQSANLKHKALLLTAYGSGLRVSELARLKTTDIDSKSMRVLVIKGKGQKDRYTILSEAALLALREYWRKYRPKSPDGYIFPGTKNVGHISSGAILKAIKSALERTDIQKGITPHTKCKDIFTSTHVFLILAWLVNSHKQTYHTPRPEIYLCSRSDLGWVKISSVAPASSISPK